MKRQTFNWNGILLMSLIVTLMLAACSKPGTTDNEESPYEVVLNKHFKNYEIVTIDYDKIYDQARIQSSSYISVNLNLEAHPDWNFQMKNDNLDQYFAPDFEMIEIGENDVQTKHQMHEVYAMEGFLKSSDQKVIMTFGLGRMEAVIVDGENEYSIEPLFNYDQSAPENLYVLYKGSELLDNNYTCDNEENASTNHLGDSRAVSNPWKVYLTYVGDYQFYQKYYNYSNASNYMYWRFYYGNKRYNAYNNVGLDWRLRRSYLYSSSGSANYNPKTKSNKNTFINECSAFYNYGWFVEGNVNYFFTGDNVVGVLGKADGIARMCNQPSKAFSFGEWRSSTYQAQNLMAHEVGHTMGCSHDNSSNNFMNASYSKWNTSIGSNARGNILWYLGYNTCLSK